MKQRRILHLWFPCLGLDRLVRADDLRLEGPLAIIGENAGAHRLVLVNHPARTAGLKPGQSLADARAICPSLLTEPALVSKDASLLMALSRWMDRFSPRIEVSQPDALILDVSGIAHLHGGEDQLVKALLGAVSDLRISARAGLADTPMAARVWSRYRPNPSSKAAIIDPGETLTACYALPVEALESDATEALRLLGLNTIGDLRQKPSAELARRFGISLPQSLDRLVGRRPEPLRVKDQTKPLATRMTLPEPIALIDDAVSIVKRIADPLMTRLDEKGLGALRFALTVTTPDSETHALSVGFSRPTRDSRALMRQIRPLLDELILPFGAERFRLEAQGVQAVQCCQVHMGTDAVIEDSMERLNTVLGNRLGFDRIRRPSPTRSHRPERECVSSQIEDEVGGQAWPSPRRHRPLQIFQPEYLRPIETGRPPMRFEWRRNPYSIASVEGPERVAPQWWSDHPGPLSDYYTVNTHEGPRLWLRRLPLESENEWSVAGMFA